MILPIVAAGDINGGLFKLGFSTGSSMEAEYKMRPDYATGTVFAAERLDVPTFKQLWRYSLILFNLVKRHVTDQKEYY